MLPAELIQLVSTCVPQVASAVRMISPSTSDSPVFATKVGAARKLKFTVWARALGEAPKRINQTPANRSDLHGEYHRPRSPVRLGMQLHSFCSFTISPPARPEEGYGKIRRRDLRSPRIFMIR